MLEFDDESEGQLTRSALDAYSGSIEQQRRYLQLAYREAGTQHLGKAMQAARQVPIVDYAALVSSANLKSYVFTRNILKVG